MSSFILKLIAILTMFIDHTGMIMDSYTPFRIVGRVAFPIFLFLCAEGCIHTKDIKKYLIRLSVFALISEVPYNMLFHAAYTRQLVFFDPNRQNVFFTLALGVLAVYLYTELKKFRDILALSVVIPCAFFAYILNTDYGAIGVLGVFFTYLAPRKYLKAVVVTAVISYFYLINIFYLPMFIGALAAVVLILFYNGKRGYGMKWAFYAAYPVHMLALVAITMLLGWI